MEDRFPLNDLKALHITSAQETTSGTQCRSPAAPCLFRHKPTQETLPWPANKNKRTTSLCARRQPYTHVQYARFADDRVILIDFHPRQDWLARAVEQRLREELVKRKVAINEEKSKIVDLANGGSFTFLGFAYRIILGGNRKWRPNYAPKLKKRTALLAKLKEIFRQNVSQPVEGVIEPINPILRGWADYFAVGDSTGGFSFVRDWVEKRMRGHLMRPGANRTRFEEVE
jgi:Group II intron, maturase-specific domain